MIALIYQTNKNEWLHVALINNLEKLAGASALVIGSAEPRIESMLLAYNVSHVTTMEYNKLTYGSEPVSHIKTVSGPNFVDVFANSKKFDVIVSISSIEHDGLGRYGDPLSPDADLNVMRRLQNLLKPDGLFFLSVPIGPDVTVYNLHRRYGAIRLPHLLKGWSVADKLPWFEERMTATANWRQTYEPIFVLRLELNSMTHAEEVEL
jgi:hypothetical protein